MKQVFLLWHEQTPVAICVFCTPPFSLTPRTKYFGLSGKRTTLSGRSLNHQLVMLSRVVIHPKYRGAGLASRFIRSCCEQSGYPWIEALAGMGRVNPFFERAGFVRVGVSRKPVNGRQKHSGIYGNRKRLISQETHAKSEFSEPVYYVFDNRKSAHFTDKAKAVDHDASENTK